MLPDQLAAVSRLPLWLVAFYKRCRQTADSVWQQRFVWSASYVLMKLLFLQQQAEIKRCTAHSVQVALTGC